MAPFFVAEVSSSIRLIILEIKMKRDFTAGWKGTVHPCFSCCAPLEQKNLTGITCDDNSVVL